MTDDIIITNLTTIINDELGHPDILYGHPYLVNTDALRQVKHPLPYAVTDEGAGQSFAWVAEIADDDE
jgi:hypothetical protein